MTTASVLTKEKEEFEDFVEEHLQLKPEFKKELDGAVKRSRRSKKRPLADIL